MLCEQPGGSWPFEQLTTHAFELFEANITAQTRSLPPLACKKECPSCCILRVAATAPEIFLLADYVQRIDAATAAIGLARRVMLADRATRGLNEADRMALRKPCPFLVRGVCIVHPVRPLACRGHASFDRQACGRAAKGKDVEVPLSEPHATLRGFVQSALQSALRTTGLAWKLYEMNHGLVLALDRKVKATNWLAVGDCLAPAVLEFDWSAEAERYDALLGI